MPYDQKPDGFVFKAVPKTARESVAQSSESQVTNTVKSAIQWYIDQYLNPTGIYRNQLKLTADFSIQYETRLNVPSQSDNPSIYEVQLARFYSQLKQRLPCILVSDTGFNYSNPGLGGSISDSRVNGRTTSSVLMKMDCSIPIKLSIAANDETTCQDLRDILLHIFGPLTTFNKAHLIKSIRPEDTWEIRLPTKFESVGLDRRPITEDKINVFWITDVSFVPEFEGTIDFNFDKQVQSGLYQIHDYTEGTIPEGIIDVNGNISGNVSTDPGWLVQTIIVPTTLRIGLPSAITVRYMLADTYFVSDNPNMALIDGFRVIPRRLGTFNVLLLKKVDGSLIQKWTVRITT